MITDSPAGRVSFEAPVQARIFEMSSDVESVVAHVECEQEGALEVHVFSFLTKGLDEGLHGEFVRMV